MLAKYYFFEANKLTTKVLVDHEQLYMSHNTRCKKYFEVNK